MNPFEKNYNQKIYFQTFIQKIYIYSVLHTLAYLSIAPSPDGHHAISAVAVISNHFYCLFAFLNEQLFLLVLRILPAK